MSRYYGYHCRTCAQSSEHWLNHGDEALQEMLDAWPTIIRPALDLAAGSGWIEVEVYIMGVLRSCDESPTTFLRAHDGHMIVVEDEYGRQVDPPVRLGVSTEGASWAMEATL